MGPVRNVGSDDHLARRPKDGVAKRWRQQRVQANNRREPGDLGVRQRGWKGQGGNGNARDQIPPQGAATVSANMLGYRNQSLQERAASRPLEGRCLALVACTRVAAAPFFHAENVLAAELTPR
jgi:hypothetical protein